MKFYSCSTFLLHVCQVEIEGQNGNFHSIVVTIASKIAFPVVFMSLALGILNEIFNHAKLFLPTSLCIHLT